MNQKDAARYSCQDEKNSEKYGIVMFFCHPI